jgi:hypothetical protein
MEDKGLKEDELLRKLKNSRSRFQIRMQQLIEKVGPAGRLEGGLGLGGRDGVGRKEGRGLDAASLPPGLEAW